MKRYLKEFKITMCDFVREKSKTQTVDRALHEVAEEAQMSYKTLKNWFYPNSYDKYRVNKGWND